MIEYIIIGLLVAIGIHHGVLLFENWSLKQQSDKNDATPTRNIMIAANDKGYYITQLASLCISAHSNADINICNYDNRLDNDGIMQIKFDNGDELLMYNYEKIKIASLSKQDINNYINKIFFDYKLPKGAERAIIQELGLLDHMVSIGICSEKSGGK